MFLKGLNNFPNIVERVIDKTLTDYYDLKQKTITVAVVKNQQLLRAIKNSTNPALFLQAFQQFNTPWQPQYNQYNSSNAPQSLNNILVPMDLSRGHVPPTRGWPRQGQGQSRENAAQLKENPQPGQLPRIKKCYNCNKPGHFIRECRVLKQARNQQVQVQDYMDQDEDLSHLQHEIHPTNLLNNALHAFDTLPLEQKDTMITQYKGKREDFVDA